MVCWGEDGKDKAVRGLYIEDFSPFNKLEKKLMLALVSLSVPH